MRELKKRPFKDTSCLITNSKLRVMKLEKLYFLGHLKNFPHSNKYNHETCSILSRYQKIWKYVKKKKKFNISTSVSKDANYSFPLESSKEIFKIYLCHAL